MSQRRIRWDRLWVIVAILIVGAMFYPRVVKTFTRPTSEDVTTLNANIAYVVGKHISEYPVVGRYHSYTAISEHQLEVLLDNGKQLALIGREVNHAPGTLVHSVKSVDIGAEGYCFSDSRGQVLNCFAEDNHPRGGLFQ